MTLLQIEALAVSRFVKNPSKDGRDLAAHLLRVPSPATIKRRLRAGRVHAMRQSGKTCLQIAKDLGISASRVRAIASDGEFLAAQEALEKNEQKIRYQQRWFSEEGLAEAERHHRQARM